MGKRKFKPNNHEFIDTAWVNDATYWDYLERLKKIACLIQSGNPINFSVNPTNKLLLIKYTLLLYDVIKSIIS